MHNFLVILTTAIVAASTTSLTAQNNRDQQVIDDRDQHQKNDDWIYNDLATARKIATESGRPMMVVFRCIP